MNTNLTLVSLAASKSLTAAREYIARGLHVIALQPRGKEPLSKGWNQTRLSEESALAAFAMTENNIGVVLGGTSNGLVDLDLDWEEATMAADMVAGLFPSFGRAGKPRSHRLIKCADPKAHKKFALPASMKEDPRLPGEHALCVLEVRGNGHYSMFPPSTHPSGEEVYWEGGGGFPAPPSRTWDEILWLGGILGFLACVIRFYPPEGVRDDLAMALSGALLRLLAPKYQERDQDLVRDVDGIVQGTFNFAGDRGANSSWPRKAARCWARIQAGEAATGLQTVVRLLGLPRECVQMFHEWLGISTDERPRVVYEETKLPEVLDKLETGLIAAIAPVFQTGGRLVHPVRLDASSDEEGVRRQQGALLIRNVSAPRLREYVIEHVNCVRVVHSKSGQREVPFAPPMSLATHYLAREDRWRLPVLRGIIETPTLRADGSLLATDGYDADSGLLLDTCGVVYPAIPEAPTREQASAALAMLKEPLAGFPFVPDDETAPGDSPSASRSVALSALLTSVCRRTLRSAPLHGFSAPTMGTGKSLLCDVVAMVATGRTAVVMSQGKSEEEDEKRLLGVLMQGDPLLTIDNIERPLSGDSLCSILTQESWQCRLLGENKQIRVPTNVLIMATGNNLTFKGDMTTRAIVCRLDAGIERPEERRFDTDLKLEVPRRRPELVAAALTVLRAFIVAERPGLDKLTPFGRFETWSDLVRGALVWLGEPDPCATRGLISERDPVRNELATLIAAILGADGKGLNVGKRFSPNDLIKLSQSDQGIREALNALPPECAGYRGLGDYLDGFNGRIVDGYRIRGFVDRHSRRRRYVLQKAGEQAEFEV